MISRGSASEDDTDIILPAQSTRRSEANAARKLAVAFFSYHGWGSSSSWCRTSGCTRSRSPRRATVRSVRPSCERVAPSSHPINSRVSDDDYSPHWEQNPESD